MGALTIVLAILLVISLVGILKMRKDYSDLKRMIIFEDSKEEIYQHLKCGAKIYYTEKTDTKCRRCEARGNKGLIQIRRRFMLDRNREGKAQLVELTNVYLCNTCEYKGLSLKRMANFKKETK